jgi:hypothetical protein
MKTSLIARISDPLPRNGWNNLRNPAQLTATYVAIKARLPLRAEITLQLGLDASTIGPEELTSCEEP